MSWFSRSFSMTKEEEQRREEDDDKDEEEEDEEEESDLLNLAEIASATGASVKEDLSNLRKTFTRQLWGVASFLAPPPPEKSSAAAEGGGRREGVEEEEEEESQQEQRAGQPQGNDVEIQGSSVAASEMESQGEQGGIDAENPELVQSSMSTGGRTSGDGLVPDESYSNVTASLHNSNIVSGEKISAIPLNQRMERPILTGLRSDFAELRGTVASGISHITSVLREVAGDDDSEEEDEDDEEHFPLVSSRESPHPLSSPASFDQQGLNSPRRSFDSFLKPLFGNILMRERSSGEPTIEGEEYPAEGEGARRDASARESPSKGEPQYRELELLPSAIASGIGGISKFAASLLQIVVDDEDEDKEDELEDRDLGAGLTEPVITFARNIAMHPETWLDFPLSESDANDDFELTDAQNEHVRALEVAAPGLEALKIELCPNYMTEGRFWKIYFVLIYSRLSTNQALMLSSQQVVRAREAMVLELQRRDLKTDELDPHQEALMYEVENDAVEPSQEDTKLSDEGFGSRLSITPTGTLSISNPGVSPFEHKREAAEVSRVAISTSGSTEETGLIQVEPNKGRFAMLHLEDETEVDEWPEEEQSTKEHEVGDPHSRLNISNLDDEDVSFSDLEEDDSSDKAGHINEEISSSTPKSTASIVLDSTPTVPFIARETSSPSTQGDGTPRKSSERGEFNDWFKVDQDDVASADSSSP